MHCTDFLTSLCYKSSKIIGEKLLHKDVRYSMAAILGGISSSYKTILIWIRLYTSQSYDKKHSSGLDCIHLNPMIRDITNQHFNSHHDTRRKKKALFFRRQKHFRLHFH